MRIRNKAVVNCFDFKSVNNNWVEMAMQEIKEMKCEVAAEALPKNEKTEQIMAQRAAAEEARQLKAEQVRRSLTYSRILCLVNCSFNSEVIYNSNASNKRYEVLLKTPFFNLGKSCKRQRGQSSSSKREGCSKDDERKGEIGSRVRSQESRGRRTV